MLVETLPIHFAPLQGYTEAIYRNAHATVFGGVETYYTPFVRLEKETFRSRDIRDIEPGNNTVSHLIPQLIGAPRSSNHRNDDYCEGTEILYHKGWQSYPFI